MSSTTNTTTGSVVYSLPPLDGSRTYIHDNADSVTGLRKQNSVQVTHVFAIENVRGSEDQYKLDNAGFQYGKHPSKHTRFLNDKEIEEEYYPECIDLSSHSSFLPIPVDSKICTVL